MTMRLFDAAPSLPGNATLYVGVASARDREWGDLLAPGGYDGWVGRDAVSFTRAFTR